MFKKTAFFGKYTYANQEGAQEKELQPFLRSQFTASKPL
jgi:hypothetical protein